MIISAAVAAAGVLLAALWGKAFGVTYVRIGLQLSVFLIDLGIPMFLVFLYLYLDAKFYLKRLEKNGYEVPSDLKDYGGRLESLPNTGVKAPVNRYASDSKIAGIISLVIYAVLVFMDILYYAVWREYEPGSIVLFVLILIALLLFPIMSIVFFRQANKNRYIDHVDINDGRHKVRSHLFSSIFLLVIFGLIGVFGIACADSITRYIYRSRYSAHDKWDDDFYNRATMQISSDDLTDGEWSSETETRSPQLSFEEVEGAAYYIIYMVDETDGCRVAWYVDKTNDPDHPAGSDEGFFRGITSHPSTPHRYSITVYALADEPDHETPIIDTSRDSSFAPMYLYYEILNVTDRSHNPPIYGNVLGYGYICGVY